jgi:tetratricopeptide (TPR) repeat protein
MGITFLLVSDVVWQGIVSNVFWLTIFLVSIILFHKELRAALGSLGSFKFASASFEFTDRRTTLKYYAIFTDIFVEMLSDRDSADRLARLIPENSIRQLIDFALKYAKESSPQVDKDFGLVINVALIVGRKGSVEEAVSIYDALLKQAPNDQDLLNLKGIMLQNSLVRENIAAAEVIFDGLIKRFPGGSGFWFNRGINKSLSGKYDESTESLTKAIEYGYAETYPQMLKDPNLEHWRVARPDDFQKLESRTGISRAET